MTLIHQTFEAIVLAFFIAFWVGMLMNGFRNVYAVARQTFPGILLFIALFVGGIISMGIVLLKIF